MGILSILFGRSQLLKPGPEKFFAILTAESSLKGRTDFRASGKAGLVFNPVEATFFDNLDAEIRDLLRIRGRSTGTRYEVADDAFGTRWVKLDDFDFEDLVTTIHLVGEGITERGFGERLLATVFRFDYEGKKAYWVYNVKRGSFYPLVLAGARERDNAAELRMAAVMKGEKMPVEGNLERWYALWDIPF